jgi:hypothetical protein
MVASHGVNGYGGHLYTHGHPEAPIRKEGDENLGCLGSGVNHFPTLIEAAMGTRIVGQLFLVAVGAFSQG